MWCRCVFQREDEKSNVGVELNKDLVKVSPHIHTGSLDKISPPSHLCPDKTNKQMQGKPDLLMSCTTSALLTEPCHSI